MKKAPSAEEKKEDPDDSLKFFKTIKPKSVSEPLPSSSNVATKFIDESSKKSQPKPRAKSTKNPSKRKPKPHADIRKVFGKQEEEIFSHVVTENCLQEGIDPDEMQLALAISESLKDQSNLKASTSSSATFENPFTSLGKVQPINVALERFGFKSKKTYSEYELEMIANAQLTKRSKFKKLPTALTRTTNEKRNEIIARKVDRILALNSMSDLDIVESTNHQVEVYSYYLQEMENKNQTVLRMSCEDRPTDNILLNFYVTELFEPSFLRADHLLKDWNNIPGRDSSPEPVRGSEKNPQSVHAEMETKENVDRAVEECDIEQEISNIAECFTTNSVSNKEHSIVEDTKEFDSCADIFADYEDCDIVMDSSDIETGCATKSDSEKLGVHLMLREKLSQSMPGVLENNENKSRDSEATIEDFASSSLDLLNKQTIDLISESESVETDEEPFIDLTQNEVSQVSTLIPIDDSYYTLQQHLENIGHHETVPIETQPLASAENCLDKKLRESFTQVDLGTTGDESKKWNLRKHEDEQVQDKSDVPEEPEELSFLSQSSLEGENEVIDISDEEVNYSMRKFHNNKDDTSDLSPEVSAGDRGSIDLTQVEKSLEEIEHLDVEVIVEQSLAEILHQEDLNIDNTVSYLLETSVHSISRNTSIDRSSQVAASGSGLSDSIKQIMSKYCVDTKRSEKSRSFRKMQSDSDVINSLAKRRKTVNFDLEENDDVEGIAQQIGYDDESMKENSIFNNSIHQSLENILEYSTIPLKQVQQRQTKSKKKSIDVDFDNDYIVDTESLVRDPDYKNMTPVELKQARFKYGIRPLPVKKAVSLLEYIHDQLHPKIRVAADEEIDANDSRREMNITDIATNIGAQEDDNYVFELGLVDGEDYVLPKMRKSKVKLKIIAIFSSF